MFRIRNRFGFLPKLGVTCLVTLGICTAAGTAIKSCGYLPAANQESRAKKRPAVPYKEKQKPKMDFALNLDYVDQSPLIKSIGSYFGDIKDPNRAFLLGALWLAYEDLKNSKVLDQDRQILLEEIFESSYPQDSAELVEKLNSFFSGYRTGIGTQGNFLDTLKYRTNQATLDCHVIHKTLPFGLGDYFKDAVRFGDHKREERDEFYVKKGERIPKGGKSSLYVTYTNLPKTDEGGVTIRYRKDSVTSAWIAVDLADIALPSIGGYNVWRLSNLEGKATVMDPAPRIKGAILVAYAFPADPDFSCVKISTNLYGSLKEIAGGQDTLDFSLESTVIDPATNIMLDGSRTEGKFQGKADESNPDENSSKIHLGFLTNNSLCPTNDKDKGLSFNVRFTNKGTGEIVETRKEFTLQGWKKRVPEYEAAIIDEYQDDAGSLIPNIQPSNETGDTIDLFIPIKGALPAGDSDRFYSTLRIHLTPRDLATIAEIRLKPIPDSLRPEGTSNVIIPGKRHTEEAYSIYMGEYPVALSGANGYGRVKLAAFDPATGRPIPNGIYDIHITNHSGGKEITSTAYMKNMIKK